MVELPEGKMKSREGTVVDADDLMEGMFGIAKEIAQEAGKLEGLDPDAAQREVFERVGLSALKYFLLKVDPKKNMMFDPKASIDFYGNTGPLFCSIMCGAGAFCAGPMRKALLCLHPWLWIPHATRWN